MECGVGGVWVLGGTRLKLGVRPTCAPCILSERMRGPGDVVLGAHVLARVTALRQGRGAGGTRFGLASVLSTRHRRPVERDSAWRRKAESEFAFPPTTPYSDSEEKGGRHSLRAGSGVTGA